MMNSFEIIQQENWNRKEHFNFFSEDNGSPLYDITAYLDVIQLYKYAKQKHLSFYYCLIWATTQVINQIEDFRYKIRGRDVILYHHLIPAFTDMKQGSELFNIVVLDFQGNMAEFALEAERVSKEQQSYFPESLEAYEPDMLIQFSCLPWLSFTSLNIERGNDCDDSVPKITWGKYERIGKKCVYPIPFKSITG